MVARRRFFCGRPAKFRFAAGPARPGPACFRVGVCCCGCRVDAGISRRLWIHACGALLCQCLCRLLCVTVQTNVRWPGAGLRGHVSPLTTHYLYLLFCPLSFFFVSFSFFVFDGRSRLSFSIFVVFRVRFRSDVLALFSPTFRVRFRSGVHFLANAGIILVLACNHSAQKQKQKTPGNVFRRNWMEEIRR